MFIKKKILHLYKIIFPILTVVISLITVLLTSEYIFFRNQSKKLLELQSDYRTYMLAVNRILKDYNKIKEELESLNSTSENQKKKELDWINQDSFLFSSDDFYYLTDSFTVVNRDLEYLQEESLKYFKQNDYGHLITALDFSDWCDYTDYLLAINTAKDKLKEQKKESKTKPKSKKVSSYRVVAPKVSKKPKQDQKKEIILSWPIKRQSFWVSSLFGPRRKKNGSWGFHYGLDMAALTGTPVYAAYTGIVVEARYARGYGNTIVLAHSRKYRTRYAHLSKILVRIGDKVVRGVQIGKVGDTGYVRSAKGKDASHLHFELMKFGKKIDPMICIDRGLTC